MFKKLVAFVLVVAIMMGCGVLSISASAVSGFGDADGNGEIDAKDALQILQYAVGKRHFPTSVIVYCDVDGDEFINAIDALYILKKAVGKINSFPVEDVKALTVALEPDFYPYSWESNGKFYGLHVDIANELAKRNGFTVEFVSADWYDLFIGIENGTYNLVMGMEATEDRKESYAGTSVSFTHEYYDGMTAMINVEEFDLSYSEKMKLENTILNMVNDGTIASYLTKYNLSKESETAYEYLENWVRLNGVVDGDDIKVTISEQGSTEYAISYSTEYDNLYVWYYDSLSYDNYAYSAIYLDTYFYGFSFYGDSIFGYIDAPYYTSGSKLTYEEAECSIYTASQMLSLAESSVDVLVAALRNFLLMNDLSITVADLGFQSY